MIGRIFFGIYKIKDIENFIREKFMKKIFWVKWLVFLFNIEIKVIDIGDLVLYIINFCFKDFIVEGECGVEVDMCYIGNFWFEVVVIVCIDLGVCFKV